MKLLFDCDGTIADSMYIWTKPQEELFKKYNHTLTYEEKAQIEPLSFKDNCKRVSENVARDMSPEDVYSYYTDIIEKGYREDIEAKPGALEILKKLKAEGFKIGVVSSTDKPLLEALFQRLEVISCFDFILAPSEVGLNKDNPKYWELALDLLDAKASETILFDDALYAVRAAKNSGILACGIKDFPYNEKEWSLIEKEADFILDNISDIDIEKIR